MTIGPFRGNYHFLSNFEWLGTPVELDGIKYYTVEHGYQASKTLTITDRIIISETPSPGAAKRMGSNLVLRPNWDKLRIGIMRELVYQKFEKNKYLRDMLILTWKHDLVEINDWGDRFWGVCKGRGENHLGKILMAVRHEIIEGGQGRRF